MFLLSVAVISLDNDLIILGQLFPLSLWIFTGQRSSNSTISSTKGQFFIAIPSDNHEKTKSHPPADINLKTKIN